MSTEVLMALVIIFICLICAGLIVYTVFFTIHKVYFRKLINEIKKYNELLNGLNGINTFKMQVLSQNDIGNKFDLNKCIEIHKQLKANSVLIKNNISIVELELNAFNQRLARNI